MKKFFNLLLVLLSLICVFSMPISFTTVSAQSVENNNNNKNEKLIRYNFLPADEMPVLGYIAMPCAAAGASGVQAQNPSFITRSNFLRYKDAGFNIVSGVYDKEPFHTSEIHKALELCEDLDLTYFVCDNTHRCDSAGGTVGGITYEQSKAGLKDAWYLNEKACGGIAVKDEPSAKDYEAMGNVNKALKELTDGKIVYTTLFPMFAGVERFYLDDYSGTHWDCYVRYVREFLNTVKPDVLAYDLYISMLESGTLNNPLDAVYPGEIAGGQQNVMEYFQSLSLFRNLSKEFNVPFWPTVASYNHIRKVQFSKKQLSWVVNSSLAYGAKGIQYYTYWPNMEGGKIEDWANPSKAGLVTQNGTPHDTYYQIKELNENIKLVQKVLMTSEHMGVIQFGKQNFSLQMEDVLYNYDVLSNITGGDTFVGCFKKPDGKPAYYILNNSFTAGSTTFKADFYKKSNIKLTNLQDGINTFENTYSVGFNLSGGQAVLLEVL